MPINQKKISSVARGQRSIFEYTKTEDKVEIQKNCSSYEVIDLTNDTELFEVKIEEDRAVDGELPVEEVQCPMCNLSLVDYTMDDRIRHVEECLSLVTLKESEANTTNGSTIRQQDQYCDKEKKSIDSQKNKRMKKQITQLDNVKEKYVNKRAKIEPTKTKTIKPPVTFTASRIKPQIPRVKTLTFPVTGNINYQVAVDAFSYAVHEVINKYFLTHFHSDHYGGITKKWCYERVFNEGDNLEDATKYKKIIFCSKVTAKLLNLYFSIDLKFIMALEMDKRYLIHKFGEPDIVTEDGLVECCEMLSPGLYVTSISANHCPGSVIFLFESLNANGETFRILHCGDFRVNREILDHPLLIPFNIKNEGNLLLNKVYLDTTYMSPAYNFPKQELVCKMVSDMFYHLTYSQEEIESNDSLFSTWFGVFKQSRITDFITKREDKSRKKKFLILVGTYVIGKERLAISILKRMNKCPIFVLNINSRGNKLDLIRTFDDDYLNEVLTDNDFEESDADCMIHLVPMKIVSSIDELSNYFNHNKYFEHFERCIGLRPTGWSFLNIYEKQDKQTLMNSSGCYKNLLQLMKTQPIFSFIENILPQFPILSLISRTKRGKHDESLYRIYTLPYSEHSSFRELSFFAIFLKIGEIIPTVNINDESSIMQMNEIIKLWETIRSYKMNQKRTSELDPKVAQAIYHLNIDDF